MSQLPDELRHAYRALLRAATYLPDSAARSYIHSYTVSRFRDVANKIQSTKRENAKLLVARYHRSAKIRQVWQLSRKLERAGQGSTADLQKVLYLTYGRAGKRRRELIAQLLEPDTPADDVAVELLIQRKSRENDGQRKPNPKLEALIQSQRFHQPIDSTRKLKIKRTSLKMPEKNIWGRPLPLKRQASIKRRFWAETLDLLWPPLSRCEWDRLRDLATGRIPIELSPPRRSRPIQEPPEMALLEYFTKPTNRQRFELDKVELGEDCITTSLEKRSNVQGINVMTPRFMRRLYATIWSMTPMMSQDADNTWITKWGGARSAAITGQVTAPSIADLELFEGADESVKHGTTKNNQKPYQNRAMKKLSHKYRPDQKVLLGEDGYTQGVTPAI